jgi:hypothetical protein
MLKQRNNIFLTLFLIVVFLSQDMASVWTKDLINLAFVTVAGVVQMQIVPNWLVITIVITVACVTMVLAFVNHLLRVNFVKNQRAILNAFMAHVIINLLLVLVNQHGRAMYAIKKYAVNTAIGNKQWTTAKVDVNVVWAGVAMIATQRLCVCLERVPMVDIVVKVKDVFVLMTLLVQHANKLFVQMHAADMEHAIQIHLHVIAMNCTMVCCVAKGQIFGRRLMLCWPWKN